MTRRLDVYVGRQLRRLYKTEQGLADEFRRVGERHADEVDIAHICELLAQQCVAHANLLGPHLERYAGRRSPAESDAPGPADSAMGHLRREVADASLRQPRLGLTLLDDLGNLYLAITAIDLLWVQVGQAAQALRDSDLLATVTQCDEQTTTQSRCLKTRIKELAPQTLTVG
jgi:hypothetical protein